MASRTTAGLIWLASDHQGTAQVSVNASDRSLHRPAADPVRHPARRPAGLAERARASSAATVDNTGLTHLGAREYDPLAWPVRLASTRCSNEDAPQQMNGYAYR